ncbi:MAG: ferritin-like domain-containing protein [bacterium]
MTAINQPQDNLFERAYQVLMTHAVSQKLQTTAQLYADWQAGRLSRETAPMPAVLSLPEVGRPEKPELVAPAQVKRRSLHHEAGRAALIHAVAHIEFNAINLALDAVYRFREMPDDYYGDWLKVAAEEAEHHALLAQRLQTLGYAYGDLPAHNGLWEMAVKTDFDVMVRMALVPRVLEARGLDVTPNMMERLQAVGDEEAVKILQIILRDEIGHVAIGSRWFHYCCEQRGLAPTETFRDLLQQYMKGELRGPFYIDARLQAGFSEEELRELRMLENTWVSEISQ